MRASAALGLLSLCSLLLAGCGGTSGTSATTGPPPVTEGTTTTHGTSANHPPQGSLLPSVVAGYAPLRVNFTLDGTDADRDALRWTLDVDGDGKTDQDGGTLPVTANHTYAAAGDFNVTFKLSDGKSEVSYHTTINVTTSVPPGAPFVPLTYGMMMSLPCQQCDLDGDASHCVALIQGQQGIDCAWTVIPTNAADHPYTVHADLDGAVIWYDTCSASGTAILLVDDTFGDESGNVPAGSGCAILFEAERPASTVTLAIT